MKHKLERLIGQRVEVKENVTLAPYTTMNVGGPADYFVEVKEKTALECAIRVVRDLNLPHFLLGCGANIIIGDAGFRGAVLHNIADRVSLRGDLLMAESGTIMYPDLIEFAASRSLSGLEHYAGIPSTVGGALWQNLHFLSPAPARERTMFIEEVLEFADLLTEDNTLERVGVKYFEFGYDQSILHWRDDVVLQAAFRLKKTD